MKTLILASLALSLIAVTFINAELAFCLFTAAGMIGIPANDYAPQCLVSYVSD
jgi:hypothetical protein